MHHLSPPLVGSRPIQPLSVFGYGQPSAISPTDRAGRAQGETEYHAPDLTVACPPFDRDLSPGQRSTLNHAVAPATATTNPNRHGATNGKPGAGPCEGTLPHGRQWGSPHPVVPLSSPLGRPSAVGCSAEAYLDLAVYRALGGP